MPRTSSISWRAGIPTSVGLHARKVTSDAVSKGARDRSAATTRSRQGEFDDFLEEFLGDERSVLERRPGDT